MNDIFILINVIPGNEVDEEIRERTVSVLSAQSPHAPEHFVENFAELVCHHEIFSNFVFSEHSDKGIFCTLNYG